jgi:hypothetical protein
VESVRQSVATTPGPGVPGFVGAVVLPVLALPDDAGRPPPHAAAVMATAATTAKALERRGRRLQTVVEFIAASSDDIQNSRNSRDRCPT